MGAGDLEILDCTYVATNDDEPQLNIGDLASGQGIGSSVAFLASEGFVSLPNPPDNGATSQVIGWKAGNQIFAIASLDGRYNDAAGTLAPGDRAIVSNCSALLYLSQSGNSIGLVSTGMALTLDGAGGNLTATNGNTTARLTSSSAEVSVAGGGSVSVNGTNVVLQMGNITLIVDATGVHVAASVGVAVLTLNGIPVT